MQSSGPVRSISNQSRKSSTSTLDSDSYSISKSQTRIKLPPLKHKTGLQVLKEESEPNTPENQKQNQYTQPTKSRFQRQISIEVSSSDSDDSEHDVWDESELQMKGIHLGDFDEMFQVDNLQLLYKIRYESHPNFRETISNTIVAAETQKLIGKLPFHWFKYRKVEPLDVDIDFSSKYDISADQNFNRYFSYFQNRLNHRKHKNLYTRNRNLNKSVCNPIVQKYQLAPNPYRIKSMINIRLRK